MVQKVNIISNDDCNEFHYLAANINCQGAVEVACRLVDMGVDLNLKDKNLVILQYGLYVKKY